jgi:hypothetical protein
VASAAADQKTEGSHTQIPVEDQMLNQPDPEAEQHKVVAEWDRSLAQGLVMGRKVSHTSVEPYWGVVPEVVAMGVVESGTRLAGCIGSPSMD